MATLRCLIVDDESPARDELRYLLQQLDDVEVVGSAATADEAAVLIDALHHDLVFLDIHMPGMDGLELAERLRGTPGAPAIVFTTAYPDHAVEAFGLDAADYLLKPLDERRLAAPSHGSRPASGARSRRTRRPTRHRHRRPRRRGLPGPPPAACAHRTGAGHDGSRSRSGNERSSSTITTSWWRAQPAGTRTYSSTASGSW
ncbi:MAG: response regulator [Ilumatobacteraceae bacterium]